MNWIHFKLCLIVVAALTPYFGSAEDNGKSHYSDDEEMMPLEQNINPHDASNVEKRSSAQPAKRLLRQSFVPNFGGNMGGNSGFQLVRGLFQAPLNGHPQDAQAASSSNKVVLILNNDKNKFAETAKPAEETLKRLTRNPDVMEDIVGQFQQLGGGATQQLLGSVSQSVPDMSKTINNALSPTSLLGQATPGNIDLSQLSQTLSQGNLPGGLNLLGQGVPDLSQLSQTLSQANLPGGLNLLGQGVPDFSQLAQSLSPGNLPGGLNLLGQGVPDFSQLAQSLSPGNLPGGLNLLGQGAPGNLDLSQITQNLNQLLGGARQNTQKANKAQTAPSPAATPTEGGGDSAGAGAEAGSSSGAESVGAAAPEDESETPQEASVAAPSQAPRNPFEQLIGGPLLSQMPQLPQMNMMQPFGLFGPSLPGLGPLMPLGSEISEVRVLPDHYSPYNFLKKT